MLNRTRNWLEDIGNNANLDSIEDKIRELTLQNAVINSRVDRSRRLARALSGFERDLNKIMKQGESIKVTKNWTEEHYNNRFSIVINEIVFWFVNLKEQQDKLSPIQVDTKTYFRNHLFLLKCLKINLKS